MLTDFFLTIRLHLNLVKVNNNKWDINSKYQSQIKISRKPRKNNILAINMTLKNNY